MCNHHYVYRAGLAAPEPAVAVPAADPPPLGVAGAAPAGLSPTHKDDAPRLAGAEGIRNQEQDDNQDSDPSFTLRKTLATLTAKMAIAGFHLPCMPHGSFLASRWGLSRAHPDLYAAHRFLRQVTGSSA